MDPLQEKFPWISPYNYASNSPIGKIDIDGLWDIEVHAYKDRKRYGYAILIVKDRMGKEVYRTTVRVQGLNGLQGGSRSKTGGDTPQGKYKIGDGQGVWVKRTSKKDIDRYGPNYVLRLKYLGGEGGNRQYMHLHGGRQKGINSKTGKPYTGNLWNTAGCMRIKDEELLEIYNITQKMEKNDPLEKAGNLTVTDDLTYVDVKYKLPIGNNMSFYQKAMVAATMYAVKLTLWWYSNDSAPKNTPKVEPVIKSTIDKDGYGYTNMRPNPGKG